MAWLAPAAVFAGPMPDVAACADARDARAYRVLSARDGTSIATAEGAVILLAGIVSAGELDGDARAASRATEELNRLAAGKNISVIGRTREDRYGRISGQAVIVDGEAKPIWLQAAMVAAGEARVAPQMDSGGCAALLLSAERDARASGQGAWSDPRFAIHGPDELERLTAAEGRFMLVEGVVRRVGESGGRIYLDFGRRFNEDFSVIVPRDAHKAFTNAGIDLRSLEGARVRVRGVVSKRGGPAIELRDPAALERLKAGGA
jgi:endonuclease YncB( thermonuclease family)